MGLDNNIIELDKETNEYTSNLSKEIAEKFKPIKKYGLIGFNIYKFNEHYYIEFRGKPYSYVVNKITDGKYDLYQDLEPETLKLMCEEFKKFLSTFDYDYEPDNNMLKNIDKLYETHHNIDEWFQALTDQYIPSPKEIKCLMEIFNLCAENNLILHACY